MAQLIHVPTERDMRPDGVRAPTDHEEIADDPSIREAIAALGVSVRLAVYHAGAGVADFRRIVDLRPDDVKIDVSLIRDINADVTCQALLVGLIDVARTTRRQLRAESSETEEEFATPRSLDTYLGQGYLLGGPLPSADSSRPQCLEPIPR